MAAIVEHPVETALPCLVVDDAVRAYGSIAAGYRQLLGIKVIGITGSVGKTTTKEMTACVLEGSFETARTEGNQNNHLGLPMSIMRISERTQVAVLEMGMNHFGEVEYLTGIAKPDVAVITNIGLEHTALLGDRKNLMLILIAAVCALACGVVAAEHLQRGLRRFGACVVAVLDDGHAMMVSTRNTTLALKTLRAT